MALTSTLGQRCDATVLSARRMPLKVRTAAWDSKAQRLEASVRGSTAYQRGWVAKRLSRMRLRRFEILDGSTIVGLCSVALGGRGGRFLDRLLLDPGHDLDWSQAMAAVLRQLPPGRYTYGWEENLEPPREDDLARIDDVTVLSSRPLVVHVVDFADWPTWEAYHRAVSDNVRRNAKKAVSRLPGLEVEVHTGRAAVTVVAPLVRLRAETYRRKGLRFQQSREFLRTLGNVVADPAHTFVALARSGHRVLAGFRGTSFGRITRYAEGGSPAHNEGASWYLMMKVFEDAYRRHPNGRLVMGYLDPTLHQESVGGGLLRQRRSCRAKEIDTSIVTFDWGGLRGR